MEKEPLSLGDVSIFIPSVIATCTDCKFKSTGDALIELGWRGADTDFSWTLQNHHNTYRRWRGQVLANKTLHNDFILSTTAGVQIGKVNASSNASRFTLFETAKQFMQSIPNEVGE